jgi:hypothetical protein
MPHGSQLDQGRATRGLKGRLPNIAAHFKRMRNAVAGTHKEQA